MKLVAPHRKYIRFVFLMCCSLLAHNFSLAASYDDEVPPRGALKLGVGYDSITGTPRVVSCVKYEGKTSASTGLEHQSTDIYNVKNSEEMRNTLRISASASLTSASGSASASVQFYTSNSVTSYNENLFAYTRVENPRELLNVKGLNKPYNTYGGYANFRRTCGDAFVVGQITGGEFFALYKLTTNQNAATQKLLATIQASGGSAKLDASTEKDFSDSIKSEQLSVKWDRTATTDPVVATPEGILSYISTFAEKVKPCDPEAKPEDKPCKQKQTVVRYILASYDEFIESDKDPAVTKEELKLRQYIDATADYSDRLRDRRATLDYALDNPTAFIDAGDSNRVQLERDKTQKQFQEMVSDVRLCMADTKGCHTHDWPNVPRTPRRGVQTASMNPKSTINEISQARGDMPIVVAFQGQFYQVCNGPGNQNPVAFPVRVSQECAEFYNPGTNKYHHISPVEGQKYKVPPGNEVRFYFFDSYHADNCVNPADPAKYSLFEPLLSESKDFVDATTVEGKCAESLEGQNVF